MIFSSTNDIVFITSNQNLKNYLKNKDNTLYAIRKKGIIMCFSNEKAFEKMAEKLPDAVQGKINNYNSHFYKF